MVSTRVVEQIPNWLLCGGVGTISLLCILLFVLIPSILIHHEHPDTSESAQTAPAWSIFQQCGTHCDSGCQSTVLALNQCDMFCSPCTGVCEGSYLLTNENGHLALSLYDSANCSMISASSDRRDYTVPCGQCDAMAHRVFAGECTEFFRACDVSESALVICLLFVVVVSCTCPLCVCLAWMEARYRSSLVPVSEEPLLF